MDKTILLAEDDLEYAKILTKLLEDEGYCVLWASNLKEARAHLEKNVHLAVIDIRLEEKRFGDNDKTGFDLAGIKNLQLIPRIIITAYPSWEYGEKVQDLEGYVVMKAKAKGPKEIIRAVNDAFVAQVCINWDLIIRWANSLSFLQLVDLTQPELDPLLVSERANELKDLFRKMFFKDKSIIIDRLFNQREGQVWLEVSAYRDSARRQFVVSCGRKHLIRDEVDCFMKYAPTGSGAGSIGKVKTDKTVHFAAIIYELYEADLEEAVTLKEFYQSRSTQEIQAALEHLYNTTLARWHKKAPFYPEKKMSLDEFYLDWLKLDQKSEAQRELERRMEALCEEITKAGLTRLKFSSNRLTLHLPDGSSAFYPNPIPYIFGKQIDVGSLVIYGETPGLLNGTSILVNPQAKTWLIDISQAGQGPLLHDFVLMETTIKFELLTTLNIQARLEMEKRLLALTHLDEQSDDKNLDPEVQKAIQAINYIRRRALIMVDHQDTKPYLSGLFFCAVGYLVTYNAAEPYLRRELISYMHSLLSAAMICRKLTSLQPPMGWERFLTGDIMYIDVSNEVVWLDGRVTKKLNPQELKLLCCLCKHRRELQGIPCSSNKIVKEVLGIETDDINVIEAGKKNIHPIVNRLRNKLKDIILEKAFECVKTYQGRGYELLIDCKIINEGAS